MEINYDTVQELINLKAGLTRRGSLDKFKKTVKLLKLQNIDYYEVSTGSMKKIIIQGRVYGIYFDRKDDNTVAVACSMVSRQVGKYLKTNPLRVDSHYPVVDYNVEQIKANVGKYVCAIDGKAFYWSIAYKNGYIDKKLYDKYLNDKDTRLIAIGALNKNIRVRDQEGKSTSMKGPKAVIWNAILKQVDTMYNEILDLIGMNNYYMWQTDCVYFNPMKRQVVEDYFKSVSLPYRVLQMKFDGIEKGDLHYTILNRFPEKKMRVLLPIRKN